MNIMDQPDLPGDALSVIFDYLGADTRLRCRGVCRRWRQEAPLGCGHVGLKRSAAKFNAICRLLLMQTHEPSVDEDGPNPPVWDRKRTRGHLPQPNVISDDAELTETDALEVVPTPSGGAAFRVQTTAGEALRSLDITSSAFLSPLAKPLSRFIETLDLSSVRTLERLSVRSCGSLISLRLPPSLVALDAAVCSSLRHISMPLGVSHRGTLALNLNGCRSLVAHGELHGIFGAPTSNAMKHARELDLSAAIQLTKPTIVASLRPSANLVSVSLRYVASDEVLVALAESAAAKTSLRLVDVAFSRELTDAAVESLVDSAPGLHRLNLRGCTSVSAECYNEVPIKLEKRRLSQEDDSREQDEDEASQKSNRTQHVRKGDNIFFFAADEQAHSKRRR